MTGGRRQRTGSQGGNTQPGELVRIYEPPPGPNTRAQLFFESDLDIEGDRPRSTAPIEYIDRERFDELRGDSDDILQRDGDGNPYFTVRRTREQAPVPKQVSPRDSPVSLEDKGGPVSPRTIGRRVPATSPAPFDPYASLPPPSPARPTHRLPSSSSGPDAPPPMPSDRFMIVQNNGPRFNRRLYDALAAQLRTKPAYIIITRDYSRDPFRIRGHIEYGPCDYAGTPRWDYDDVARVGPLSAFGKTIAGRVKREIPVQRPWTALLEAAQRLTSRRTRPSGLPAGRAFKNKGKGNAFRSDSRAPEGERAAREREIHNLRQAIRNNQRNTLTLMNQYEELGDLLREHGNFEHSLIAYSIAYKISVGKSALISSKNKKILHDKYADAFLRKERSEGRHPEVQTPGDARPQEQQGQRDWRYAATGHGTVDPSSENEEDVIMTGRLPASDLGRGASPPPTAPGPGSTGALGAKPKGPAATYKQLSAHHASSASGIAASSSRGAGTLPPVSGRPSSSSPPVAASSSRFERNKKEEAVSKKLEIGIMFLPPGSRSTGKSAIFFPEKRFGELKAPYPAREGQLTTSLPKDGESVEARRASYLLAIARTMQTIPPKYEIEEGPPYTGVPVSRGSYESYEGQTKEFNLLSPEASSAVIASLKRQLGKKEAPGSSRQVQQAGSFATGGSYAGTQARQPVAMSPLPLQPLQTSTTATPGYDAATLLASHAEAGRVSPIQAAEADNRNRPSSRGLLGSYAPGQAPGRGKGGRP